jgi:pimeloyl-ACP methyl ester carboxylesterase
MRNIIATLIGCYINGLSLVAPERAGRTGFAIFSSPFRKKVPNHQIAFYDTGHKFEVPFQGSKLQAYKWGTGDEKILFLHGWQSSTFFWRKYVQAIDKSRYTIYAFDAPAHGLSTGRSMTVPQYSEAIKTIIELIGKPDVMVGHSVGAFTAVYAIFHHRNLAPNKIVTLAMAADANDFLHTFKTALGLSKRSMHLVIQHFVKTVNLLPEYFSIPIYAKSLEFPVLIIHDEDDKQAGVENARLIHSCWKGSHLMLTKGLGHKLKSKEVVKEVVNFIDK